jgi:phospholipid-binding lipoprotein MlaA
LTVLLLGACSAGNDPRDPFETLNRHIFEFNDAMDAGVIRPIAVSYRQTVPAPVRTGIRNALNNLGEPVVFANNLLQFRLYDAGHTLMRFYLNSTVGLAGVFDVATPAGIAQREGDFGQTLYTAGIGDGPFLMLPLLGPSNVRDTIGRGVDSFIDPVGLATGQALPATAATGAGIGRTVVRGIDLRAENIETLDALRAGSLDYYARLRSVVEQRRNAQLGRSSAESGAGLVTLDDPGG